MAPDVPTFKEQGFDVVVGSWRCVIGPKGMPADRIAFLESNILAVLKDPEFQARAKQSGFIVGPRRRQGDGGALEIRRRRALSDPAGGRVGEGTAEVSDGSCA